MRALLAVAVCALAFAGTAAAVLQPGIYDPGRTGCTVARYAAGWLHLEKRCPSATNASAGANINGFAGQAFQSASFTLASASQCQGGSPRFNVQTSAGFFFLGCNNVTPVVNADGTATYAFTAATIAAAGNQVPVPTGAIQSIEVLVDVEGTADLTDITVNGEAQVPTVQAAKDQCKKGGWRDFTSPAFKNQGDCVSYFATGGRNPGNG